MNPITSHLSPSLTRTVKHYREASVIDLTCQTGKSNNSPVITTCDIPRMILSKTSVSLYAINSALVYLKVPVCFLMREALWVEMGINLPTDSSLHTSLVQALIGIAAQSAPRLKSRGLQDSREAALSVIRVYSQATWTIEFWSLHFKAHFVWDGCGLRGSICKKWLYFRQHYKYLNGAYAFCSVN